MPGIANGTISLANVNTQFGRASNSLISMGTAPIAHGAGSWSNNITQMSGFYYI